jgi:3-methyl-2-oxobutanoate hydroxymethyltransferase
VLHDLLGMNLSFKPKFLRRFFDAETHFKKAFQEFHESVQNKSFPTKEESYST